MTWSYGGKSFNLGANHEQEESHNYREEKRRNITGAHHRIRGEGEVRK